VKTASEKRDFTPDSHAGCLIRYSIYLNVSGPISSGGISGEAGFFR
jgi:hypothetical protein